MAKRDSRSSSELTLEDRFWAKVDKKGPNKCWEWTAGKNGGGYGAIDEAGKSLRAHRVSWELTYGSIPKGLCVLHHCDNKLCCNPSHLFLGTQADNIADKTAKGRQAKGEGNGHVTLMREDVFNIRRSSLSQGKLGRLYGVSQYAIWAVKNERTWKHLLPNRHMGETIHETLVTPPSGGIDVTIE